MPDDEILDLLNAPVDDDLGQPFGADLPGYGSTTLGTPGDQEDPDDEILKIFNAPPTAPPTSARPEPGRVKEYLAGFHADGSPIVKKGHYEIERYGKVHEIPYVISQKMVDEEELKKREPGYKREVPLGVDEEKYGPLLKDLSEPIDLDKADRIVEERQRRENRESDIEKGTKFSDVYKTSEEPTPAQKKRWDEQYAELPSVKATNRDAEQYRDSQVDQIYEGLKADAEQQRSLMDLDPEADQAAQRVAAFTEPELRAQAEETFNRIQEDKKQELHEIHKTPRQKVMAEDGRRRDAITTNNSLSLEEQREQLAALPPLPELPRMSPKEWKARGDMLLEEWQAGQIRNARTSHELTEKVKAGDELTADEKDFMHGETAAGLPIGTGSESTSLPLVDEDFLQRGEDGELITKPSPVLGPGYGQPRPAHEWNQDKLKEHDGQLFLARVSSPDEDPEDDLRRRIVEVYYKEDKDHPSLSGYALRDAETKEDIRPKDLHDHHEFGPKDKNKWEEERDVLDWEIKDREQELQTHPVFWGDDPNRNIFSAYGREFGYSKSAYQLQNELANLKNERVKAQAELDRLAAGGAPRMELKPSTELYVTDPLRYFTMLEEENLRYRPHGDTYRKREGKWLRNKIPLLRHKFKYDDQAAIEAAAIEVRDAQRTGGRASDRAYKILAEHRVWDEHERAPGEVRKLFGFEYTDRTMADMFDIAADMPAWGLEFAATGAGAGLVMKGGAAALRGAGVMKAATTVAPRLTKAMTTLGNRARTMAVLKQLQAGLHAEKAAGTITAAGTQELAKVTTLLRSAHLGPQLAAGLHQVGKGATFVGIQTALNPGAVMVDKLERQVSEGISWTETPSGKLRIVVDDDVFSTSGDAKYLLKGYASQYIETATEHLGGVVAKPVAGVKRKLALAATGPLRRVKNLKSLKIMPRVLTRFTTKLQKKLYTAATAKLGYKATQKIYGKFGIQGIVEEIGEEHAADIARGLTGEFLNDGFGVTGSLVSPGSEREYDQAKRDWVAMAGGLMLGGGVMRRASAVWQKSQASYRQSIAQNSLDDARTHHAAAVVQLAEDLGIANPEKMTPAALATEVADARDKFEAGEEDGELEAGGKEKIEESIAAVDAATGELNDANEDFAKVGYYDFAGSEVDRRRELAVVLGMPAPHTDFGATNRDRLTRGAKALNKKTKDPDTGELETDEDYEKRIHGLVNPLLEAYKQGKLSGEKLDEFLGYWEESVETEGGRRLLEVMATFFGVGGDMAERSAWKEKALKQARELGVENPEQMPLEELHQKIIDAIEESKETEDSEKKKAIEALGKVPLIGYSAYDDKTLRKHLNKKTKERRDREKLEKSVETHRMAAAQDGAHAETSPLWGEQFEYETDLAAIEHVDGDKADASRLRIANILLKTPGLDSATADSLRQAVRDGDDAMIRAGILAAAQGTAGKSRLKKAYETYWQEKATEAVKAEEDKEEKEFEKSYTATYEDEDGPSTYSFTHDEDGNSIETLDKAKEEAARAVAVEGGTLLTDPKTGEPRVEEDKPYSWTRKWRKRGRRKKRQKAAAKEYKELVKEIKGEIKSDIQTPENKIALEAALEQLLAATEGNRNIVVAEAKKTLDRARGVEDLDVTGEVDKGVVADEGAAETVGEAVDETGEIIAEGEAGEEGEKEVITDDQAAALLDDVAAQRIADELEDDRKLPTDLEGLIARAREEGIGYVDLAPKKKDGDIVELDTGDLRLGEEVEDHADAAVRIADEIREAGGPAREAAVIKEITRQINIARGEAEEPRGRAALEPYQRKGRLRPAGRRAKAGEYVPAEFGEHATITPKGKYSALQHEVSKGLLNNYGVTAVWIDGDPGITGFFAPGEPGVVYFNTNAETLDTTLETLAIALHEWSHSLFELDEQAWEALEAAIESRDPNGLREAKYFYKDSSEKNLKTINKLLEKAPKNKTLLAQKALYERYLEGSHPRGKDESNKDYKERMAKWENRDLIRQEGVATYIGTVRGAVHDDFGLTDEVLRSLFGDIKEKNPGLWKRIWASLKKFFSGREGRIAQEVGEAIEKAAGKTRKVAKEVTRKGKPIRRQRPDPFPAGAAAIEIYGGTVAGLIGEDPANKSNEAALREFNNLSATDKISPFHVGSWIDAGSTGIRDITVPADFEEMVVAGLQQVRDAIGGEATGQGYYFRDIRRAIHVNSLLVPELLDNSDLRSLFMSGLAITSPGQNLSLNNKLAMRSIQEYMRSQQSTGIGMMGYTREHGVFPSGVSTPNIRKGLNQLGMMAREDGVVEATDWLFEEHSGRELFAMRTRFGQWATANATLTGTHYGLRMFGPKVGPYGLNLKGIPTEVTIDLWQARQIARWSGVVSRPNRNFSIGEQRIVDNVTDRVRPHAQRLITEIARRAGIQPSDAQAILWYSEKQLYQSAGYARAGADANLTTVASGLVAADRKADEDYGGTKEDTEADIRGQISLANVSIAAEEQEPPTGRARQDVRAREEAEEAAIPEVTPPSGLAAVEPIDPRAKEKEGLTRYERTIQERQGEGRVPEGVTDFSVESERRGTGYLKGLTVTRKTHKLGAAVEIKDESFYTDPSTRLYLTADDSAGVALTPDDDLVSVFKTPASTEDINPILDQASKGAKTLDAYDINNVLPNLYARHGFRPVARVRFNREFAPKNWPYDIAGEPDIVLMVRDVDGVTGLIEAPAVIKQEGKPATAGYGSVRDQIPVFDDWDEAKKLQDAAVSRLKPAPRRGLASVDVVQVKDAYGYGTETKEVRVFSNPSEEQAKALLKKHGTLRGLVDGKDLLLWPAADAIHVQITKVMGIVHNDLPLTAFLYLFDGHPKKDVEAYFKRFRETGQWLRAAVLVNRSYAEGQASVDVVEIKDAFGRPAETKEVKVFSNISEEKVKSLLKEHGTLRGIVDGKDLMIWSATDAIHEQIAKAMGVAVEDRPDLYMMEFFNQKAHHARIKKMFKRHLETGSWIPEKRERIGVVGPQRMGGMGMGGVEHFDNMGTQVRVYRNPTRDQAIGLLFQRRQHVELRGLIDGKDLYLWDAMDATHDKAARELGLDVFAMPARSGVWLNKEKEINDYFDEWLKTGDPLRSAKAAGINTEFYRGPPPSGSWPGLGSLETLSISDREAPIRDLRTWVNPGKKQLLELLKKTETVRLLTDGIDLWAWEGYEAVHVQVAHALGIEYEDLPTAAMYEFRDYDREEDRDAIDKLYARHKRTGAWLPKKRFRKQPGLAHVETIYDPHGRPIRVLRNPNERQALELVGWEFPLKTPAGRTVHSASSGLKDTGPLKPLRGLIHGETLFLWSAFRATHDYAAKELGLDLDELPANAQLYVSSGADIEAYFKAFRKTGDVMRSARQAGITASFWRVGLGSLEEIRPEKMEQVPWEPEEFSEQQGEKEIDDIVAREGEFVGRQKGEVVEDEMDLAINQDTIMNLLSDSMYKNPIDEVTVKELVQNSFDALKVMPGVTVDNPGKIEINYNEAERTITVKDNGLGMSPKIVSTALFTIGGTYKPGKAEETSGGLGLAKMAFMMGSDGVIVDTVKDGVRTEVDVTREQIKTKKIPRRITKVPGEPSGTSVTVKIPKSYISGMGEVKEIEFNAFWVPFLQQPLLGPVEITKSVSGYATEIQDLGVHTKGLEQINEFNFKWGDILVHRWGDRASYPRVHALSSGLWQFEADDYKLWGGFGQTKLPWNVILDVRPKIRPGSPMYPFNLQRENWAPTIQKDIEAMYMFMRQMAQQQELLEAKDAFTDLEQLANIDPTKHFSQEEIEEARAAAKERLRRAKEVAGGATGKYLKKIKRVDMTGEGQVLHHTDGTTEKEDKLTEETFKAKQEIDRDKVKAENLEGRDTESPQYHNNTTARFEDIPGHKNAFAEFGSSLLAFIREWGEKVGGDYEVLAPGSEDPWFAGIAIDNDYRGVNTVYPLRGIWINIAAISGDGRVDPNAAAYETMHLFMHEMTHVKARGDKDGPQFTAEMANNYAKIMRYNVNFEFHAETLVRLYLKHWDIMEGVWSEFNSEDTTNIRASLKAGERAAAEGQSPGVPPIDANQLEGDDESGRRGDRGAREADSGPLGEILRGGSGQNILRGGLGRGGQAAIEPLPAFDKIRRMTDVAGKTLGLTDAQRETLANELILLAKGEPPGLSPLDLLKQSRLLVDKHKKKGYEEGRRQKSVEERIEGRIEAMSPAKKGDESKFKEGYITGQKEMIEVKVLLYAYARTLLPKGELRKIMAVLLRARTPAQMDKVRQAIWQTMDNYEKNAVIAKLKGVFKKGKFNKLRPEYKEKITELVELVALDKPSATALRKAETLLRAAEVDMEFGEIPSNLIDRMVNVIERSEKKPIREMETDDLKSLYAAIEFLIHLNVVKNKTINRQKEHTFNEDLESLKNQILGIHPEERDIDDPIGRKGLGHAVKLVTSDTMQWESRLVQIFGQSDLVTKYFIDDLQNGNVRFAEILEDAQGFMREQVEYLGLTPGAKNRVGFVFDQGRLKEIMEEEFEIELPPQRRKKTLRVKGRKIKLTGDQFMGLILAMADNETRAEMLKDDHMGIIMDTQRGRGLRAVESLDKEDLKVIWGIANQEEHKDIMALAGAMHSYVNTVLRDLVNTEFVNLFGYEIAHKLSYWMRRRALEISAKGTPGITDKMKLAEAEEKEAELWNQGPFRPRAKSNQPFVISGAMGAFFGHVNRVAAFVSKTEAEHDARAMIGALKSTIEAHVPRGHEKAEDLLSALTDYRGLKRSQDHDSWNKFVKNMTNWAHPATLGFKPQIMAYQVASYFTAMAEIGELNMILGNKFLGNIQVVNTHTKNEVRKFSPVMWARLNDSAQQILSPGAGGLGVREFFGVPGSARERISYGALYGIKYMDAQVVYRVWRAAKRDISKKRPDLEVGGTEFMQAVARRTEEVFRKTQPTWDPLTISALARRARSNPNLALLTMYGTQRNQNTNITVQAYLLWKQGYISAAEAARRIFWSQVSNAIIIAGMRGMWQSILAAIVSLFMGDDDEEEEKTWAEVFSLGNLAEFFGLSWQTISEKIFGNFLIAGDAVNFSLEMKEAIDLRGPHAKHRRRETIMGSFAKDVFSTGVDVYNIWEDIRLDRRVTGTGPNAGKAAVKDHLWDLFEDGMSSIGWFGWPTQGPLQMFYRSWAYREDKHPPHIQNLFTASQALGRLPKELKEATGEQEEVLRNHREEIRLAAAVANGPLRGASREAIAARREGKPDEEAMKKMDEIAAGYLDHGNTLDFVGFDEKPIRGNLTADEYKGRLSAWRRRVGPVNEGALATHEEFEKLVWSRLQIVLLSGGKPEPFEPTDPDYTPSDKAERLDKIRDWEKNTQRYAVKWLALYSDTPLLKRVRDEFYRTSGFRGRYKGKSQSKKKSFLTWKNVQEAVR